MKTELARVPPQAVRHGSSAALLLVGVLAGYNWLLAPHVGCLHAMQKLESAVGRVVEEKVRIGRTLAEKAGQRQALQRELAELEQGVFTPGQARTFRPGLLPLVEQTGCTVVTADFARPGKSDREEDPNVPVMVEASSLSLDVEGTAGQVAALLQRLRDHRPRIWVDSCRLDFPGGDSGRTACHLGLTFYIVAERKGLVSD